MSRAKRVFAAFGIGIANQALGAVGSLWLTRFSLHRVGSHDFGLWAVAGQVLTFIGLADLGVIGILPRDVALAVGKGGAPDAIDGELRVLLERSLALVMLLLPPLIVASVGIVALLPSDWAELRGPVAVYLAGYVMLFPFRIMTAALTGLQDLVFVGWMPAVALVVSAGATVSLLVAGYGLYGLAGAWVAGQCAVLAAATMRLLTRYPRAFPRRIRWPSKADMRDHFSPGLWVTVGQIANLFSTSTEVLVVGRMLGPEAVLVFSFTDKTENLLNYQPFSVGNLSGPSFSELKGSGRVDELPRRIATVSAATLLLSGGVVLAILETNAAFVRVWVGESFYGGLGLTVALLANMMLRHGVFAYHIAIFFYSGRIRAAALLLGADGIVSFTSSIFLVRWLGVVGAPLGSCLGAIVAGIPALWLIEADVPSSLWASLRPVGPWLLRFAPLAVVAAIAGDRLAHRSLPMVAAVGAVIGAVYLAAMLPLVRRPPLDVYAGPILARLPLVGRLFAPRAPE